MTMARAAGIDLLAALAVKTLPPFAVKTLPLLRSTRRGEFRKLECEYRL
jgi:hypothetical protein